VFRGEYRWSAGSNDWQLSAERALTGLDNVSTFFELLPDGSFQEIAFPNASGDVQDRRYEGAVKLTRRVSPTLTLRTSLGVETSQLEVLGGMGSKRTSSARKAMRRWPGKSALICERSLK
jgi:hypothetical protein